MPTPLKTPQLNFALGVVGPLPWQTGQYPYFESLTSRSDVLVAHALRSQADIDSLKTGSVSATKLPVLYDPVQDAALFRIDPSGVTPGSGNSRSQQKWVTGFTAKNTSMLVTWDFRFDQGWQWNDPTDINRHKTWWVSEDNDGAHAWVLAATDYKRGANNNAIAELILTIPSTRWLAPGASEGPGESIAPRVGRFFIQPNVWTRYWIFAEGIIGGGEGGQVVYLSCWAADENNDPVQLYDRVPMYTSTEGFNSFRFAYDTSDYGSTQSLMQSWNRNFVMLTGVSLATVQGLLTKSGL